MTVIGDTWEGASNSETSAILEEALLNKLGTSFTELPPSPCVVEHGNKLHLLTLTYQLHDVIRQLTCCAF